MHFVRLEFRTLAVDRVTLSLRPTMAGSTTILTAYNNKPPPYASSSSSTSVESLNIVILPRLELGDTAVGTLSRSW